MTDGPPAAAPPPLLAGLLAALLLAALALHGAVAAPARAATVAAILLLGIAAVVPALARGRFESRRDPLDLPLVFFLAASLPGAVASLAPRETRDRLLWDAALVVFAMLVARAVHTRRAATVFAGATATGVAFWSALALVARGDSLAGVRLFSAPGERLSFTFVNPDHLAALAGAGMWFALGAALARRGASRALLAVAAILPAVALVLSASRGAGIAACVAGVLLGTVIVRRRPPLPGGKRLVAAALLSLPLLLLLAPERVGRRLATLASPRAAAASRLPIWEGGAAMIAARPVVGWGAGSFEASFPPFAPDALAGMTVNRAHSDPLELLAERGLLGGLAAMALLGVAAVATRRRLATADDGEFALRAGAAAAATMLLVQGLADFVLPVPAFAMLLVALLHLASGNWGAADAGSRRDVVLPGGRLAGAGLSVALLALAASAIVAVARPVAATRRLAEARAAAAERDWPGAFHRVVEAQALDFGLPAAAHERARILAILVGTAPAGERSLATRSALMAIDRARRLAPADPSLPALESDLRALDGDARGALAAIDEAIRLAPTVADHHLERGGLLLAFGRREAGEAALRRGLALAPREVPAVVERLELLGWSADEIDVVIPATSAARRELGRRRAAGGDPTAAAFELRAAYEASPSGALAAEHLAALLDADRDGDALSFAREYVARHPLDPAATNAALRVFARLGLFAEAWPVWERRLAAEPANAMLRLAAAPVLEKLGRLADASRLLDEASRLAPTDPRIPRRRAALARRSGDHAGAAGWLERAVVLAPTDPAIRVELATELRLLGDPASARRQLKRCLELVPGDAGCAAALD